jgi:multidrug efflux pump subunit AcrA (membrane-fusion protein)
MKTFNHKFLRAGQLLLIPGFCVLLYSCGSKSAGGDDEDAKVASQTPVTVTAVSDSTMVDYIDLNATSTTLQKNFVKSNATGYIDRANVQLGQNVSKGEVLFTVKTKESQTIGNSINVLDTSFKFSGINRIKASASGYISTISHQTGDYVQDGEQLAIISDRSSFVFLMQLPYELKQYVKLGQNVDLMLPGGTKVTATVKSFMPSVDTVSQTQGIQLKANTSQEIPENLTARARIVKSAKTNTISLPKAAVLANETQTEFWVMKMINPTTAIKVPVKEGIKVGDRVEILSPRFTPQDQIIVTGNYGLTDTAKVKITKPWGRYRILL